MNGLVLITGMGYIKVGNNDNTPDGIILDKMIQANRIGIKNGRTASFASPPELFVSRPTADYFVANPTPRLLDRWRV